MAEIVIPRASETPISLTEAYSKNTDIFFKDQLPEMIVYVEDDEDKPFWGKMFACINDKRKVSIIVLKRESQDAITKRKGSSDELNGKDVLMRVPNLSDRKVVAVDADYDLLIDYHEYSERIRTDKFVIHTEYYSIENHLLEASIIPHLSIWNNVKPYIPTINWSTIINALGSVMTDSVKLCIASIDHREKAYKANPTLSNYPSTIKIKDIKSGISRIQFTPKYQTSLDEWRTSFENDIYMQIRSECNDELEQYAHWSTNDVVQNIQGHTLYKFVSKAILYYFTSACNKIIKIETGNVTDKTLIPSIIQNLNIRLGINNDKQKYIEDSIYSADALDMNDVALERIKMQIRGIFN